jgi:hypothetical protein
VLIVLVTMVVGAFVFWQGLQERDASAPPAVNVEPSATTEQTVASTPASTVAPPTTAAARPPGTKVPPAELPIVVGNGVDPERPVAGTVAGKLAAAGYTGSIRKMNASRTTEASKVHFAALEWREDAVAVAKALGIAEIDVTPLPNPPPVNDSERKVFVIVGREPRALSEPTR